MFDTLFVLLIIIAVLLAVFILRDTVNFDESTAVYGNRLEGRDKVIISEETKSKVIEKVKEKTSKVNVRVAGKIIYIDMTVTGDVNVAAAKDLANKALEEFSDAEKAYYDIQAIISSDTDTEHFPIIGYKHHNKKAYVWTKDR